MKNSSLGIQKEALEKIHCQHGLIVLCQKIFYPFYHSLTDISYYKATIKLTFYSLRVFLEDSLRKLGFYLDYVASEASPKCYFKYFYSIASFKFDCIILLCLFTKVPLLIDESLFLTTYK